MFDGKIFQPNILIDVSVESSFLTTTTITTTTTTATTTTFLHATEASTVCFERVF